MKYTDKIYGEVNIDDDVVIDIINSKSFQRLRGIDQAGYFDVYFPGTKHSRFEHSVGCYLLLKQFGASLEEQIAGLIHDMSHSAFSHTADYVFESGRGEDHNFQDDIFVDFVRKTEIPNILNKYNLDSEYILNEDNFPLQENELPELCADRIDYSLRGAVVYGISEVDDIAQILQDLTIINNKWIFKKRESAQKYANIFKKLNDVYYSNKETAAMFLRTSEWIKYASDKQYITFEDLFTTDEYVIKKINKHLQEDVQLQKLWNQMNNPEIITCSSKDKDCKKVIVKSRIVDPSFRKSDEIRRLSQVSEEWANIINFDSKAKTHFINVA